MYQEIELSPPFVVPKEMFGSVVADLKNRRVSDAFITGLLIPVAVLADLQHIAHTARRKLFGNRRSDESLRAEHTEV
jgi:hypothetical protein